MNDGLLGNQPTWIIGALIGAGIGLTIFVVIPTLIHWVWHYGESDINDWSGYDDDE